MDNKTSEYVAIIGGTNIDIQGFPKKKLILQDSNIGNVKISLGGVGRNIAENLARLGVNTNLISIIGDDVYGNMVLDYSKEIGLNMDNTLVLEGEKTSVYLSILNEIGDMEIAISSMDIYEKMDIEFIEKRRKIIESSSLCIIDTNVPKDTIEYILTNYKGVDFFLDTVSTFKTERVKDLIGCFHTIKPNKLEVEILTGIKINNNDDLKKAAEHLHRRGVKRVFITLGDKGVFYSDGISMGHKNTPKVNIVNATGAGDAFVAALAYGYINNIEIEEVVDIAMYASIVALSHEDTINPKMSIEEIYLKMKENENARKIFRDKSRS
ncbi:MAG: carbohydrate kinase family protein [Tissierellaceae bacterium]|nr:carbohydrate kinase family protein [Tissierellaceae bacterium]